jgi:hypothetical protein
MAPFPMGLSAHGVHMEEAMRLLAKLLIYVALIIFSPAIILIAVYSVWSD